MDGDAPALNSDLARTLKKIAMVSAVSFVFAFSLVPLYNAACEKVFGIKLERGAAGAQQLAGIKPDDKRTVRVQFDGTVNSKLAWDFLKPAVFTFAMLCAIVSTWVCCAFIPVAVV